MGSDRGELRVGVELSALGTKDSAAGTRRLTFCRPTERKVGVLEPRPRTASPRFPRSWRRGSTCCSGTRRPARGAHDGADLRETVEPLL